MEWQEVSVTTTEWMQEATANIFYEVGASGVVIEDPNVVSRYLENGSWDCYDLPPELLKAEYVVIKGYFPVDRYLPGRMEEIQEKLNSLEKYFDDYYGEISISQIKEEDWANAWKSYYKPQRIGQRIVIVPSWENYESEEEDIIIRLDPGLAFGTGTHPTTRMCLENLERYVAPGSQVYDVGTGSGVLAIASAKLGAGNVIACDNDDLAVRVAQENVIENDSHYVVEVVKNDLLEGFSGTANLISANITANMILKLKDQAFKLLTPGGIFIASGIIESNLERVQNEFEAVGFIIEKTVNDSEWVTVIARRK